MRCNCNSFGFLFAVFLCPILYFGSGKRIIFSVLSHLVCIQIEILWSTTHLTSTNIFRERFTEKYSPKSFINCWVRNGAYWIHLLASVFCCKRVYSNCIHDASLRVQQFVMDAPLWIQSHSVPILFLQMRFVCRRRLIESFKNNSYFCLNKDAIQLENTKWIFGGMFCPICGSFSFWKCDRTIFESYLWILLAFHLQRWRYYKRFGCFQHCRQNNIRWKSYWIDNTFLWRDRNLFRCETVSGRNHNIWFYNERIIHNWFYFSDVLENSTEFISIRCLRFSRGPWWVCPVYSWHCNLN